MNSLDALTWFAGAIVFMLVGTAIGVLVYPWIKYGLQQWLAHWQRETDKLGEMQHEGVDEADVVRCQCEICGRQAPSSEFVMIPWRRCGPLTGDVLKSGRVVVCANNQECRTQGKLLQLEKCGYLSRGD